MAQMPVLVAEDDFVTQELLRAFLTELGFEVRIAETGDEAWESFRQAPVRMVITDWNMPGLSGVELCRRIRSASQGHYTYLIMLTASRENISGLEAGADEFVTKPFDPTELSFRIKSGLRVLDLEDRLEVQIRELDASRESLQRVHRRLRAELDGAAGLQRALLPKEFPDGDVTFAWSFDPSEHLGGDTFNVFKLAEHRYSCLMADVCGHGIKPSLLAVTLQHVLNPRYRQTPLLWCDFATDQAHRVVPPSEVLARLNLQFPMDLELGQYFTMLYSVLESDTGLFRYSTAGHPPPILLPACGPPRQLPGSGFPIGMMEEAVYDVEHARLKPGDRLLLFTDGLTETKNGGDQMIGVNRVLYWLDEGRLLDTRSIVDLLARNVRDWAGEAPPDDDVSLLMIEYQGSESCRTASGSLRSGSSVSAPVPG